MKVDIAIYLFMEAAFDMQEVDVSRKGIREYASQMARHLRHVADLSGVLQRDGWNLKVVRNSLVGTHPDVKTTQDATNRLIGLGIPDDVIDIREWDGRGKRLNAVCRSTCSTKREHRTGVITKNTQESLRLQKAVRAKRNQCYINALRVIWNEPEYSRATYVEGIAVVDGMCIGHGWVERDGELFDPTLPEDEIMYFAGLRFEGEQGVYEALKRPKPEGAEDLPFFNRYGWGGSDSREFCKARQEATNYCSVQVL